MDRNRIKRRIFNSCMAVCDATLCRKSRDRKKEQKEYLKERERIERILEENKKLEIQQESAGDFPAPTSRRRIRFADLPEAPESESFNENAGSLTDEMPLRFKMRNGGDRRNAMGRSSTTRRKSLMKGILSVASGGEKPPLAELKEGKTLPAYLEDENERFRFPECCNKPLPEPDDFYARKTYIVVNKQGTIFRFSKAESLFLFGEKSRTRSAAIKLFITPMFANFITFIIMCNCACMVLAEPPTWVEDYLEYVFTSIYIIEACIKIVARGFVLHKFSYLRDPWNWLDFVVIISAIITEILKAAVSSAAFGQVGVLRAFRVLRALKTMSVVPGLRGIVKALLRSIRALKDAVVLTVFCVSVFALVGYQLFAGTLRQKCVRIPGSLDVAPEALFYSPRFDDQEYTAYVHTYLNQSQSRKYFPLYVTDIERQDLECSRRMAMLPSNGVAWSAPDATLMGEILNATKTSNCTKRVTFRTMTSLNSSLLRHADRLRFERGGFNARWNCHVTINNMTSSHDEQTMCDVIVSAYAADIKCLNTTFLFKNNRGGDDTNATATHPLFDSPGNDVTPTNLSLGCSNESDYLSDLLEFGVNHVRNWQSRGQVIMFDLLTSAEESESQTVNSTFLYYSELTEDEMTSLEYNTWLERDVNHCKSEPTTGLYYYVNSSNRPIPEPLYCAIGSTDVCPIGFDCQEAGANPDFGYTSFDHFFLAFLTSFRLVALDAWSRLYYLTLHTVGQTYSIFYILVVLLGSYYLVNLILAVVYMAYEEQQAVVEEEEEEAREREEEKRVLKGESSLVDEESNHSAIESDVELGGMRLITTSLASHDECPTSPFIRKKRRFMMSQSNIHQEEVEEDTRSGRIMEEECVTVSDGNSRSGLRRKKKRNKKKRRAPSSSDKENSVFSARSNPDIPTPVVKLVVTSAVDESGTPSLRDLHSRNSEFHLSVGEAWRRPLATSSDDEGRREKPKPFTRGNLPIIIPLRNLSESSSFSDENIPNKRVVKVDMNYLCVDDKSSSLPLLSSSRDPSLSSRNPSLSSQDVSFRNHSSRDQSPASGNRTSAVDKSSLDDVVSGSALPEPAKRSPRGSGDSRKGILLHPRRSEDSSCSHRSSADSRSLRVSGGSSYGASGSSRGLFGSSGSQRSSKSSGGNSTSAKETDGWESGDEEEAAKSEMRNGRKKRRRTKSRRSNQSPECSEKETLLPTVTSHDSKLTYDVIDDDVIRNFSSVNQNGNNDYERITHLESINFLGEELHSHQRVKRRKLKDSSAYFSYLKLSRSFVNTFGRWKCCPPWWARFQKVLRTIVLNPFTDLLITLCIALNTFFMSLERYPMDKDFSSMLDHANLFFTLIFTVEMLTKIVGLTPYTYFKERWNVFDAVVVFFSVLELLINSAQGFSVLRAFRLMRILKLAKQWPTLNKLLRIIGRTLGKLWHLTLVFLLVLFIFAVVGMQLLRKYYLKHYHDNQPRWNFVDFKHSFMVVFRIQCGEWVENMFNCLHVAEPGICIPLFVLVYIIGNLVILNLFLALLLNSFSGDILQQTTAGNNSITEAFRHLVTWFREKRDSLKELDINSYCCRLLKLGVRASPIKMMENIQQTEQIGLKDVSLFRILPQNGKPDEDEPMFEQPKTNGKITSVYDPVKTDDVRTDHGKHYHNHDLHEISRERIHENNHVVSNGNHKSGDDHGINIHDMRRLTHSRVSAVSGSECRSASRLSTCGQRRKASAVARERFRGMGEDTRSRRKSSSFTTEERSTSIKADSCANEENEEEEVLSACFCCGDDKVKEGGNWFKIRKLTFKVAKHRYFDNFVIFCILLSSVTLALEDIHIHKKPTMKKILKGVDIFCCIFFTLEMLIKWIGLGLKKYFSDPWCILDFIIVLISIINLSLSADTQTDFSALRVLRTFRALRPLRALSRFEGMKIVVDALIRAVPSIGHVFLVCIIFWLIFSILGVNLFGGSFGRCVSLTTGDILPSSYASNSSLIQDCSPANALLLRYLGGELDPKDVNPASILPRVAGKLECEQCAQLLNTTLINWHTPSVNFDTVFGGYLALLQVATFNGWLEIMEATIDITGVEMQPSYEASFYYYLYYCVFIVFGAFFSLNLFIGVIIDNFNQQKLKSKGGEDGVFLTEEQKRYYNAMKRMASKTPKKPIPRPNNVFANKIYDVVTSRKFEILVMLLIMLNLVVMAIEHRGMTQDMSEVLQYSNLGFICVFVVEAVLKLIGLRWYYFTVTWNVFDLLVVVISLIATGLHDLMEKYFVQPTIFRIIRLFRVTRILRLIREAKGIRTLLFALMMSLPALFNIGSLLFLLMFIYAIIGMSQFPYVQKVAGIDNLLNFETFPNAFLVLFQVSTSEGWDKFIDPVLRDTPPYCDPAPPDGSPSNCGNSTIGVIYFVTYVMITFLIVVNMYIAIILENFEVATRESGEPLTADDFEQFFEVWQRYDDRLSQYVTYEQLQHLLHHLDFPLRVPMPNRAFIAHAQMRITLDGRIHCLEVIISLIKKVLGDSPELNNLKEAMLQNFMLRCNSKETEETKETIDALDFTVKWEAANCIKRAYKNYKLRQQRAYKGEFSDESDEELEVFSSADENESDSINSSAG